MILAHENHTGHECSKDLCKDIVRDLLPWEALPVRQTDGDGGMEVTTRCWTANDDGEGDTDSVCPTNLEDRTKLGIGTVEEH